jgi:peroxiredoxin
MKRYLILVFGLLAAVATAVQEKPLAVGQPIPDVSLRTASGDVLALQAAAKEQPLVIIFYRGGWCPFCNRHLGQLQEAQPKLKELGYRILAISPDRPEKLAESLDKVKMSYTLLSDSSMATAKAFGIAFEVEKPMLEKLASYNIDIEAASGQTHHLLPIPSVFIVGTDGIIDFVYANSDYKIRLAPEVVLAEAKNAL